VKDKGSAKAMIAIGGSSQSAKYVQMSQTQADRNTFVDGVIAFLEKYHFDGIMLDWQYPASDTEAQNFISLLDKFDEKFAGTSFIMGTTGAPLKAAIDNGYHVPKIIDYLDFIHVLTYDFHGQWDSKTGYAAPIAEQENSLELWTERGAPIHKLLMSMPLFARTWKLSDPADNEKGASTTGPGSAGPYTQTAGMLSYNELCTSMRSAPNDWVVRRDTNEPAIYAVHGHDWISFEDPKTIKEKVNKVTKAGYGGIVVYALSNDDFHGDCGGTKFPLLRAVNEGLDHSDVVGPVTTTTTKNPNQTTTTHATTSVTDDGTIYHCLKAGSFRDHIYCRKYYTCTASDLGIWEQLVHYCDRGFAFDETTSKCIAKEGVKGCENS